MKWLDYMRTLVVVCAMAAMLPSAIAQTPAAAEKPQPDTAAAPYLAIEYADTLNGVQALYAVRVCSQGEQGAKRPLLREKQADTPDEIIVRLIAADGREVSRYAGIAAICDYAKFAAAYIERNAPAVLASSNKQEQ